MSRNLRIRESQKSGGASMVGRSARLNSIKPGTKKKRENGRGYRFDATDVLSSESNDENDSNLTNVVGDGDHLHSTRSSDLSGLSQALTHLTVSSVDISESQIPEALTEHSEDRSFEFPLYGSPTKPESHQSLYVSAAAKIEKLHDVFSQLSVQDSSQRQQNLSYVEVCDTAIQTSLALDASQIEENCSFTGRENDRSGVDQNNEDDADFVQVVDSSVQVTLPFEEDAHGFADASLDSLASPVTSSSFDDVSSSLSRVEVADASVQADFGQSSSSSRDDSSFLDSSVPSLPVPFVPYVSPTSLGPTLFSPKPSAVPDRLRSGPGVVSSPTSAPLHSTPTTAQAFKVPVVPSYPPLTPVGAKGFREPVCGAFRTPPQTRPISASSCSSEEKTRPGPGFNSGVKTETLSIVPFHDFDSNHFWSSDEDDELMKTCLEELSPKARRSARKSLMFLTKRRSFIPHVNESRDHSDNHIFDNLSSSNYCDDEKYQSVETDENSASQLLKRLKALGSSNNSPAIGSIAESPSRNSNLFSTGNASSDDRNVDSSANSSDDVVFSSQKPEIGRKYDEDQLDPRSCRETIAVDKDDDHDNDDIVFPSQTPANFLNRRPQRTVTSRRCGDLFERDEKSEDGDDEDFVPASQKTPSTGRFHLNSFKSHPY